MKATLDRTAKECKEGHLLRRGWCPCQRRFDILDLDERTGTAAIAWLHRKPGSTKRLIAASKRLADYRRFERRLDSYNDWIQDKHPERWGIGMAD